MNRLSHLEAKLSQHFYIIIYGDARGRKHIA